MKVFAFIFAAVLSNSVIAQPSTLNQCMSCHSLDKKLVGPSFKDIATKYKDKPDYVSAKIKSGGSGVWGPIPMPAQKQLTETQVKELTQWILSLSK